MDLSSDFWNNRYLVDDTGWDMGKISPPIKSYIDQLQDKEISILIPGGGNSYEAEYLHQLGFKHVTVVDIAEQPLQNIKKRVPTFSEKNLQKKNFFKINEQFDLIIEQTFFCAIDKKLRKDYAKQIYDLLKKKGKLIGLLFNVSLYEEHPPFGGDIEEYNIYFAPYFTNYTMTDCYNSHPSRKGREVWINLTKK